MFTFDHLDDTNEVQSSIPSHMKQFSTLDVKIDGSLRVKRHTVVFMGQQGNSDSSEKKGQENVASFNNIVVRACEDSTLEIELVEIPETFEDGGQATVDDMKELNLRTADIPRLIYVS